MEQSALYNSFRLYDSVPVGIFIIDKEYNTVFWNSCLEDWIGVMRVDIVGKPITTIIPELDKFIYRSRLDFVFQGGPPVVFSNQFHKNLYPSFMPDGRRRIHHTNVNSIEIQSTNEVFALFAVEDITELADRIAGYKRMRDQALEEIEQRRAAEESLRESEQKLLEMNATKDKFFSIIAHDIKNPLSVFMNVSDLLSSMIQHLSETEIIYFANEIHNSAKNLYALLENLLTWSRSQTGRLNFFPEEIDLSIYTESVSALLDLNAKDKNIEIIDQVPADTCVYCDTNMLSTIIRNLLSNAIKFTPEGGKITIFSVDWDTYIEVGISDTGVGISDEDIGKLFKIDASHTTLGTRDEKGTGLGLILCRDFVEKHKTNEGSGRIWVESCIGEGTTFRFTLPKTRPHIA